MLRKKLVRLMAVWLIWAFFFLMFACRKASPVPVVQAPVTLNIIHAMPNGHPIVPLLGENEPGKYFIYLLNLGLQINYGSALVNPYASTYSAADGANRVRIAPVTDTAFYIFNGTLDLQSGGIYSFFLAGDTLKPDTALIRDVVPSYADSSAGIRFANMASGGKSLTINLAGDPASLATLSYLHPSGFIKYPAKKTPGNYTFEIRDGATGDLLTSFTWIYTPFRNHTAVISGSTNPADGYPLRAFSYKNF